MKNAIKLHTYPNQVVYQLTQPWAGLATGTHVTPLRGGTNNDTDWPVRHERTMTVVTGPRAGDTVTGEY